MNYFRSEFYRAMRTKSLYVIVFVFLAFLTQFYLSFTISEFENNSPTGLLQVVFFFVILSSIFLGMVVISIFGGKKLDILKQTISFGISKRNIYLVKFLSPLIILFLFLIFSELIIGGFERYFYPKIFFEFIIFNIRFLNVLPMIMSSFALCLWLNFCRVNEVLSLLIIFFTYFISFESLLDELFFKKSVLYPNFPATLLSNSPYTTTFEPQTFFTGLFLLLFFLFMGYQQFNKKDVA